MKKNKKKIILVLVIIISIITAIIINKNKIKDEEVIVQITGKAVEEKQTEEYKLSNIKMYAQKSKTEIILTIKNISGKETVERDVYIKYLDKNNNEIGKTRIHVPQMKSDKEITLSSIITKDLKEAADYIIEYK